MSEPLIGIWWDNGCDLVALSHAVTEQASGTTMIDSDLTHVDEWPKVAQRFGKTVEDEYFEVPRGRVVFDRKEGFVIIYHGTATDRKRLELIAAEFRLSCWVARLDDHYEIGKAVDELFDD